MKAFMLPLLDYESNADSPNIDNEEINESQFEGQYFFDEESDFVLSCQKMESHLKERFFIFAGEEPENARALFTEWLLDENSDPREEGFFFMDFIGDDHIDREV